MTTSQHLRTRDRSAADSRMPSHPDRGTRPNRSAAPERRLLVAVVALAAVSVGGAFVSVAGGLADTVLDAMGPTGRLSIPVPMMLAQLLAAWVASGRRRRPALVTSALLAVVAPVCIASGFFDGGYSDPARTGVHTAYQGLLVGMLAVVAGFAVRRLLQLGRCV